MRVNKILFFLSILLSDLDEIWHVRSAHTVKKCFILKWIIQKSQLTDKLTKLNFILEGSKAEETYSSTLSLTLDLDAGG